MYYYIKQPYLKQCIVPKRWTTKSRCRSQEARIRHFLDCFTNRQHQSGVDERDYNVGVKIVCIDTNKLRLITVVTEQINIFVNGNM